MQPVTCSLQSVVCSLHSAVCSLQSAICSLQSAVCSLQMSDTVSPVTANKTEVEISKFNASKAVGPSSIPIVILKTLHCELSGPLETIFNTSFLTGIVPEKSKMVRVITIF